MHNELGDTAHSISNHDEGSMDKIGILILYWNIFLTIAHYYKPTPGKFIIYYNFKKDPVIFIIAFLSINCQALTTMDQACQFRKSNYFNV